MGLDTSHDCWHGAYSAFSRWREKLAEVAGYEIAEVKFKGQAISRPTVLIDYGHITAENYQGVWATTPADPLILLIAHSDCDGAIYPEDAGPLADRLEQLLPKLAGLNEGGHIGLMTEKTQAFIDGLRAAVRAGEPVEFH